MIIFAETFKNNFMKLEEQLHQAVAEYLKLQYPQVIFNSDMSGVKLTKFQAVKASKLRSSRAFPDLVIYEPRGNYHGLFIELKAEGTRLYKRNLTPVTEHIKEQLNMLDKLYERGYCARFAVGFDEAKKLIDEYLK